MGANNGKGPRQRAFITAFFLIVVPAALTYLFIEYTATYLGHGFVSNDLNGQPLYVLWALVALVLGVIFGLTLAASHTRMIKRYPPDQAEAANTIWHIAIVVGIMALGAAEHYRVAKEFEFARAVMALKEMKFVTSLTR